MKARLHMKIFGQVQGVFFRAGTLDTVNRIQEITGWVRNLDDGSVECMAEGEKEKLEELLEWCSHGPAGADVERIEEKWEEYSGDFRDFSIRYSW